MFHKVRANIFETNSSYTHSLAVCRFPLKPFNPGCEVYLMPTDRNDAIIEHCTILNLPEKEWTDNKWLDMFSYIIWWFSVNKRYKVVETLVKFYEEFTGYPLHLVCCLKLSDDDIILDYVKDSHITVKFMVYKYCPWQEKRSFSHSEIRTYRLYTCKELKNLDIIDCCRNDCDNLYDIYYGEKTKKCYSEDLIFAVHPDEEYSPLTDERHYSLYDRSLVNWSACIEIDFFFYEDIPDEMLGRIIADYMRFGKCSYYIYGDYDYAQADYMWINKNGNGYVTLFDDGTKIITSEDDDFIPEYPISLDIKIIDKCSHNCPFCYENSVSDGADGNAKFIKLLEELPETTEVAIGGGNPIESSLLERILLSESKCTFTFTINQKDIDNLFSFVPVDPENEEGGSIYSERKFKNDIYTKAVAIGISVTEITDEFIKKAEQFSKSFSRTTSVVWHFIAGVVKYEDIIRFLKAVTNSKILILGYKENGRGIDYLSHNPEIAKNQKELAEHIEKIRELTAVTSFDNLAIEQLDMKGKISEEEWALHYLGKEGRYSMFIDMVKGEFTLSSNDKRRWKIEDGMSIKDMFGIIRKEAD